MQEGIATLAVQEVQDDLVTVSGRKVKKTRQQFDSVPKTCPVTPRGLDGL